VRKRVREKTITLMMVVDAEKFSLLG